MGLKETIKEKFNDPKVISEKRLKSSRVVLIMFTFLFFLNFFLVGANFYYDLLIVTLPYTYFFFLFNLFLYSLILIKLRFPEEVSKLIYYSFCFILFWFFIFLLFPFVTDDWIFGVINYIKNNF